MTYFTQEMHIPFLFAQAGHASSMDPREWPTYGHDYGDTRFSPLTQITSANVGNLEPAWVYHMKPPGQSVLGLRAGAFLASEDTPLVVGGIMYVSDAL